MTDYQVKYLCVSQRQSVMSIQGPRSIPWEKEEGGGLWVGPCIMNRSLPDVEVREEGTSQRENIMCKTQSSWQSVVAGEAGYDLRP